MSGKVVWEMKSNEDMSKIRQIAEKQFPKILDREELENISSFFKG
ncbi:MAG: hypothetical protein K0S25_2283 [Bacillus sp. (in: firmicutes)]|nr:hypothetical protein [Bacillus sp. (in: firmicutes)]